MIYLWMFLALCIVCVSGYIGQVLNVVSAVSSFFGMVILAALIYYFTMWLTGGNELVTGIFMFLAPACGLMINKGESIRVFPLSNWTEQDIWQYIWLENIDIVPLYLAAERPVLERDGMLMMIDDNRIDLQPGEVIKKRMVRFRTLGCWPLTGAVESNAQTLPEIIEEMLVSTTSERQGRVIDRDQAGSMELKKRQGYF